MRTLIVCVDLSTESNILLPQQTRPLFFHHYMWMIRSLTECTLDYWLAKYLKKEYFPQYSPSRSARLQYTAAKVNTFGEMSFPENSVMQTLSFGYTCMQTLCSSTMKRLYDNAIIEHWDKVVFKIKANLILLTMKSSRYKMSHWISRDSF